MRGYHSTMLILEQLWQGQITPFEREIKEDSEYQKLSHKTTELQNQFYKELTSEGKKAFNEYYDIEQELASISEQDAFIKGVQVGARIILDIMGEYRSPLPQIKK